MGNSKGNTLFSDIQGFVVGLLMYIAVTMNFSLVMGHSKGNTLFSDIQGFVVGLLMYIRSSHSEFQFSNGAFQG